MTLLSYDGTYLGACEDVLKKVNFWWSSEKNLVAYFLDQFVPSYTVDYTELTLLGVSLLNYNMRLMLFFILYFKAKVMISNKLAQLHLKQYVMKQNTNILQTKT